MCYATPAQTKLLPTKLFNATLIQPGFFKLSENDFRGLYLYNLESLRIYHFTLHSHKLTFTILAQFDFRVLHLHNMKSLSMIQFCILHSHNLTFPTFDQLFRSCCVCMFRYIYIFHILHKYIFDFVLIFMSISSHYQAAQWTQTGMRIHFGWKSHFGVQWALYLCSHELRRNESQNGMDFIRIILTEMQFQTGMRFHVNRIYSKRN